MPRRPRASDARLYYHVINRGAAKSTLFARTRDYRDFLGILREGLARHPVPLVAYCLLANHWHLVLGPTGTARLSRLLHWVTTTHAVRLRVRRKTVGEGPIYQGRFKSHPIDESGGLVQVCRYVERNALTAGLVRRAQDWPWGSLADRQRADPSLTLAGAPFLSSNAWVELVNAAVTRKEQLVTSVPKSARPVEISPVPLSDEAEAPGGLAGSGKRCQQRVGVVRRAHEDEADAHVERAEHFRIVKLARLLKPREQRRNRPAVAVK